MNQDKKLHLNKLSHFSLLEVKIDHENVFTLTYFKNIFEEIFSHCEFVDQVIIGTINLMDGNFLN